MAHTSWCGPGVAGSACVRACVRVCVCVRACVRTRTGGHMRRACHRFRGRQYATTNRLGAAAAPPLPPRNTTEPPLHAALPMSPFNQIKEARSLHGQNIKRPHTHICACEYSTLQPTSSLSEAACHGLSLSLSLSLSLYTACSVPSLPCHRQTALSPPSSSEAPQRPVPGTAGHPLWRPPPQPWPWQWASRCSWRQRPAILEAPVGCRWAKLQGSIGSISSNEDPWHIEHRRHASVALCCHYRTHPNY